MVVTNCKALSSILKVKAPRKHDGLVTQLLDMSGVVHYSFKDYMIAGAHDVVDEKKLEVI